MTRQLSQRHRTTQLAGLGLGLLLPCLGLPAWAQGAPCFVVPLAGAQASSSEGPIERPSLARDCASLVIRAGQVRVIYSNQDGQTFTPLLAQGERFTATDAAKQANPYDQVNASIVPTVRREGAAAPLTKGFDRNRGEVGAAGGPFGEVHLPPGGLSFKLLGPAPGTRFQILDDQTQRLLQSGEAGGEILLDRKLLKTGSVYVFQLIRPTGTLAGKFTTADGDIERRLNDGLSQLGADRSLDPESRRIGEALLYEQQSLSFNREVVTRRPRP